MSLRLPEANASPAGITELYYLAAVLFLQTQQFFGTDENADCQRRGILKAYSAAVAMVKAMTMANRTFRLFDFIPNYLFRMLFNATCVVWKILTSSYRDCIDFRQGKANFNEALSAVRKCSVENNDVAGRHAEILAQLWRISCGDGVDGAVSHDETGDLTKRPPELGLRGRFGASLSFDCLFYWREHVGGQRRMGLHAATTGQWLSFSLIFPLLMVTCDPITDTNRYKVPVILDQIDETSTPRSATQPSIVSPQRPADVENPFQLHSWEDVNWSSVLASPNTFLGLEL